MSILKKDPVALCILGCVIWAFVSVSSVAAVSRPFLFLAVSALSGPVSLLVALISAKFSWWGIALLVSGVTGPILFLLMRRTRKFQKLSTPMRILVSLVWLATGLFGGFYIAGQVT